MCFTIISGTTDTSQGIGEHESMLPFIKMKLSTIARTETDWCTSLCKSESNLIYFYFALYRNEYNNVGSRRIEWVLTECKNRSHGSTKYNESQPHTGVIPSKFSAAQMLELWKKDFLCLSWNLPFAPFKRSYFGTANHNDSTKHRYKQPKLEKIAPFPQEAATRGCTCLKMKYDLHRKHNTMWCCQGTPLRTCWFLNIVRISVHPHGKPEYAWL